MDTCSNCPKFIAERDKVLKEAESVFDSAFDLNQFQTKCFQSYSKNPDRVYTRKQVAQIILDLFGDSCACNFNSHDEWLPFVCDGAHTICVPDDSVDPTYCWEQYLKHLDKKNSIDMSE